MSDKKMYRIIYITFDKYSREARKDLYDNYSKKGQGFFMADSKIEAVNNLLYEILGRKTDREIASIESVKEKVQ